jgi:hypothetical protein
VIPSIYLQDTVVLEAAQTLAEKELSLVEARINQANERLNEYREAMKREGDSLTRQIGRRESLSKTIKDIGTYKKEQARNDH